VVAIDTRSLMYHIALIFFVFCTDLLFYTLSCTVFGLWFFGIMLLFKPSFFYGLALCGHALVFSSVFVAVLTGLRVHGGLRK